MTLSDKALGRLLAAATTVAMAATQGSVGFARDEGYYFAAAARHEQWLDLLWRAPAQALSAPATEAFWSYNSEHPGLMKLLFALSHAGLSRAVPLLPDALSWRLPSMVFAGLLTLWLARLGFARSRAAGVLAPLLFWTSERTFFHGHLAAFDVPICALTAGTGVAWARALGILGAGVDAKAAPASGWPPARAGAALALVFGAALAVKHNAWTLPPLLAAHALLCPAGWRGRALRTLPWLLLGPVVLLLAWPLLWHDPARHLREWIEFHLHHVHYAWWYFGALYREPPFPAAYPLVLDALVFPVTTVALLGAAAARLLWRFARRRLAPLPLLELLLAAGAVFPFLLRTTPIFGGIKHWLAFPALLTPEAAGLLSEISFAFAQAARGLPALRWAVPRRALGLGAAAALLPGLWQIAHLHPYGTSAYGELAGGVPGAASLGMQRQYWSTNVTAVLPWLNQHAPPGARVYLHEVNPESALAYQRAGLLRRDLVYAPAPEAADYAALQWHREFRDVEPRVWNSFGTRRPAAGLYLDEVAQIVVYARPGLPGAPPPARDGGGALR